METTIQNLSPWNELRKNLMFDDWTYEFKLAHGLLTMYSLVELLEEYDLSQDFVIALLIKEGYIDDLFEDDVPDDEDND